MKSTWKRCTDCQKIFPKTADYFHRHKRDGFIPRCKRCIGKQKRADRERHPERVRKTKRKWYQDHKEEICTQRREERLLNLDEIRAKEREYNAKNRARIRLWARNWRFAHREQVIRQKRAAYHTKAGKEYAYTQKQKRRSKQKGLPMSFTITERQHALNYFGGCCAVCGRPPGLWHTLAMDHWIPITSPDCPGTIPTNIVPLCHAIKDGAGGCNNSKSNKPPEQWLIAKFGERKAKQILKRIHDYFDSLTCQSEAETE